MIKKYLAVCCVLVAAVMLSSCTIHHSIGDNFGSYLASPGGQEFKPVGYRWDYENTALLYVYRPASEWSMDEIETPSFNVNGDRLFNIKGGGYTWYELKPGSYDVVIRRGVFGFEGIGSFAIKRIAEITLQASVGKVYYFRYSEIDPPEIDPDLEDNPVGDGPLQLVAPSRALAELPKTRMIHRGRGLLAAKTGDGYTPIPEDQPVEENENQGIKASSGNREQDWWPF